MVSAIIERSSALKITFFQLLISFLHFQFQHYSGEVSSRGSTLQMCPYSIIDALIYKAFLELLRIDRVIPF